MTAVLVNAEAEQIVEESISTRQVEPASVRTSGIVNIQRYCVQDGEGIRTVVFLKGCPLRCPWCSNPESTNAFFEVGHFDSACDQCGECLKVCEPEAITLNESGKGITIDREKCTNCGQCIPECTRNALRPFGKESSRRHETTVDEVFQEIRKDYLYYSKSGGGLTLSGGEVLGQPKLAAEILRRAQAMGIDTAIETSGFSSISALDTVLEHVDQVLFDLKIMDSDAHLEHLGVPNEPIHRNARRIVEKGVSMVIRVPLIPTLTDTRENIRAIAEFVKELDPGLKVHLLPYHRLGVNKHEALDREYKLQHLKPQTDEELGWIAKTFEDFGLDCEIIR